MFDYFDKQGRRGAATRAPGNNGGSAKGWSKPKLASVRLESHGTALRHIVGFSRMSANKRALAGRRRRPRGCADQSLLNELPRPPRNTMTGQIVCSVQFRMTFAREPEELATARC